MSQNPALVPEPQEAQPQEYKVPDELAVPLRDPADPDLIRWPGETFLAIYSPEQEARLIRRGQLQKVVTETTDNQSEED